MNLSFDEIIWNVTPTSSIQVTKKTTSNNPTTCKAQATFPRQLFTMLGNAEKDGYSHICSWKSHGRAFEIYDRDAFMDQVTPLYFSQKRFGSFQRQLNLWGFLQKSRRVSDPGSYYHELFLRGRPDLCLKIRRVKSIDALSRLKRNEPNFYKMKPVGLDEEPLPSYKAKQSRLPCSYPSCDHSIDSIAFDKLSKIENLESLLGTPVHALNHHPDSPSFNSTCPSLIDEQSLFRSLDIPILRDSTTYNPCQSTFAFCANTYRNACVSVPQVAQQSQTYHFSQFDGDINKLESITPLCSVTFHGKASNNLNEDICCPKVLAATETPSEIVQIKRSCAGKVLSLSSDTLVRRKSRTRKEQRTKSDFMTASLDAVGDMSESEISSMVEFLLDVDFDAC